MICEECKTHSYAYLTPELKRDARRKYADGKNVVESGQCMCYGPEHGEGEYL